MREGALMNFSFFAEQVVRFSYQTENCLKNVNEMKEDKKRKEKEDSEALWDWQYVWMHCALQGWGFSSMYLWNVSNSKGLKLGMSD